MGYIFGRSLNILFIIIFIIWAFIKYTFLMFVVLFVMLFLLYMILMKDEIGNPPSADHGTNVGEGRVFLSPAKQVEFEAEKKRIELHNQKMKKYKMSQQQKKEFKKVAKKYNSKGTEKVKKELDKNFAETGRYESDKSKKSRLDKELKIANARKKNRWIPGDQHRGDWNDK
tara:strand:- start:175 stop:687 length:513 start_codon:yes stop_codon:yes gene_type:complete